MVRHTFHLVVAVSLSSLVLAPSLAGAGEACCPKYDQSREMTVEGVVEKVERRVGQAGVFGVHLVVAGEKFSYDVHLGPVKYLKKLKVRYTEGEELLLLCAPLVGAKAEEREGRLHLEVIAREITRDGETVRFRDEAGRPLWSGRGRPIT